MSAANNHDNQTSTTPQSPINPYAPSTAAIARPVPVEFPRVSAIVVILSTIGGVTASGGIFGVGLAATARSGIMIAPIAFVFGCILAFIGALIVVPLMLTARIFLGESGRDWTASQILRFGGLCGGLTGFLCVAGPALFTPSALPFALIPGLVGSVLTTLFLIPLSRRVRKQESLLLDSLDARANKDFGR